MYNVHDESTYGSALFALFAKPLGGVSILDRDPLTAYLRKSVVARLRGQPMLREPPSVYLGIVNNPAFRLCARRVGSASDFGVYVVAIYDGTYCLLRDFFNRCFAHREFMPSVGDPSLEIVREPTLHKLCDNFQDLVDSLEGGEYKPVVPRCPVRRERSYRLLAHTLTYLVQHEITHVVNGHLDLLSHSPQVCGPSTAESRLGMRTLEYDADACAFLAMFIFSRVYLDKKRDLDEEIADIVAAAYSALFFGVTKSGMPPADATHPSPRVRQFMGFATWATQLMNMPGIKFDEQVCDTLLERALAMEEGYALVTGLEAESRAAFDERQHPFLAETREHWKVLHPLLVPYAYVKIPNPNDAPFEYTW